MKFTCSKKILSNKISIVQKAINNKVTIEQLKGILLVVKDNTLSLTAYDLELAIITGMEVESEENGKTIVNARLFSELIRKLQNDMVIFSLIDGELNIKCGRSSYQIKTETTDGYPTLPELNQEDSYVMYQSDLKQLIKETSFAVSCDTTKPILMGEYLELENDSITLTAIDGYRLATSSIEFDEDEEDSDEEKLNYKIIIPGKCLNDLSNLLNCAEDEEVKIDFDDKHAIFDINNATVITRVLSGEFIAYKKLIPNQYNTKIEIDREAFLNSVERASLISSQEKNNLVKFEICENSLVIKSNSDKGKVREEIDIITEGEELSIAFNSRYLLEGIRAISSDKINIEFTSSVNPCILKPVSEESYIYLLLPVRTSGI